MEKLRKIAYAGCVVFPALLCAPGCGGDPPPTPPEVEDVTVEELEQGATTGIELGTQTDSPIDSEGEATPAASPDKDAPESE